MAPEERDKLEAIYDAILELSARVGRVERNQNRSLPPSRQQVNKVATLAITLLLVILAKQFGIPLPGFG